jgi:hypothetical protein
VTVNITSIALTAGDWGVSGMVGFEAGGGSTVLNYAAMGVTDVSATFKLPSDGVYRCDQNMQAGVTGSGVSISVGEGRFSIAVPTTIYLIAFATFTVSTMFGYGFIGARRAR